MGGEGVVQVVHAGIGAHPSEGPFIVESAERFVDAVPADGLSEGIELEGCPSVEFIRLIGIDERPFTVEIGTMSPVVVPSKELGGRREVGAVATCGKEGQRGIVWYAAANDLRCKRSVRLYRMVKPLRGQLDGHYIIEIIEFSALAEVGDPTVVLRLPPRS